MLLRIGNPSDLNIPLPQPTALYPIETLYSRRYRRDNLNDWDAEYIQHDAAINPRNSGARYQLERRNHRYQYFEVCVQRYRQYGFDSKQYSSFIS